MLSPTAPTSPSLDKVQTLTIACPADQVAVSPSGIPIQVSFASPAVHGGLTPVTSVCGPASGSMFPPGATTVRCEAQDGIQQTASCSLVVSVLQSLGIARIVAFGDSITRGIMSGRIRQLDRVDFAQSFDGTKTYPFRLQTKLQNLFGPRSIKVINQGRDGELAREGLSRLSSVLAGLRPDTVLLMEGTNDLVRRRTQSELMGVALAMERQVREARRQGVDVLLATIPPARRYSHRIGAPVLSNFLRDVAVRQNVPLVDIFTRLNEAQCSTLSLSFVPALRLPTVRSPFLTQAACIGDDDLHPTAKGYELIADEFFTRILQVYGPGGSQGISTRMKMLFGSRGY